MSAVSDISRGYGAGLDPTPELVGQPSVTHFKRADRTITDQDVRCTGDVQVPGHPQETKACNRMLAELVGRPWRLRCPRCKTVNRSPE